MHIMLTTTHHCLNLLLCCPVPLCLFPAPVAPTSQSLLHQSLKSTIPTTIFSASSPTVLLALQVRHFRPLRLQLSLIPLASSLHQHQSVPTASLMTRVGQGPLRFGFDPLSEAVSWDYNAKRKADGGSKPLRRSGKREREFLENRKRKRKRERSEPTAKRTAEKRYFQYHVTFTVKGVCHGPKHLRQ
jgi:hypothetical protein